MQSWFESMRGSQRAGRAPRQANGRTGGTLSGCYDVLAGAGTTSITLPVTTTTDPKGRHP